MLRRALSLLLLTCAACAGSSGAETADSDISAIETVKVNVESSAVLPLKEISGLGVRTVSGKPSYLAISDSATTLVTFGIDKDGNPSNVEKRDLKGIFGGGDSQWEAVAGDSAGRVFIMSEAEGTISVLSKDFKLDHVITLTMPDDHDLFSAWDRDENSRGEGMLLLANGHILVAKEKGPAAIIEFAPKGTTAEGYTPELALKNRAFKTPSGKESEFEPVAYWELKTNAARLIGDISDLTTDADGTLIVLSDQSRAMARLERELSVDEGKIDLKAVWDLPREVEKPEGLTIVNGKPFVACDLAGATETSFFSISAL